MTDLLTALRCKQHADQQHLARQLDELLHQALQVAAQLEATGVRDGVQGLALRECSAQLEAAAGWATGVRLHVG